MEIDVMQVGGFWLPSVPVMLNNYAKLHANETLWMNLNGSLRTLESEAQSVIPRPFVIRSLFVRTIGEVAQPGDGGLIVRVKKNGQVTPLSVEIPAGHVPPHKLVNRTDAAYFDLGDLIAIELENLSGADSAIIGSLGLDFGIDHALR